MKLICERKREREKERESCIVLGSDLCEWILFVLLVCLFVLLNIMTDITRQ